MTRKYIRPKYSDLVVRDKTIEELRQQLAECQAQVKQAKREALLEAAELCEGYAYVDSVQFELRRMAKELE